MVVVAVVVVVVVVLCMDTVLHHFSETSFRDSPHPLFNIGHEGYGDGLVPWSEILRRSSSPSCQC